MLETMSSPSPVVPNDFKALVSDPTASMCGNFINTLLKLPMKVYQFFNWALDSAGKLTNAFQQQIVHSGDLIFSAAPLSEDATRKQCNGQLLLRANFPDLFTAIGTVYGAGDGITTFQLPDYTARFPVGVGTFQSGDTVALAQKGGEEKHALDTTEIPPHTHFIANTDVANNGTQVPISGTIKTSSSTDHSGGSFDAYILQGSVTEPTVGPTSKTGGTGSPVAVALHNNLPPYIGCYIYIKT